MSPDKNFELRIATARKMPPTLCWVSLRRATYSNSKPIPYEWHLRGTRSQMLECSTIGSLGELPESEGWEVRRRFLRVKSPEEAVLFLNAVGRFSPATHRGFFHEPELTYRTFTELQNFTRHALLHDPDDWEYSHLRGLQARSREWFNNYPQVSVGAVDGVPLCFLSCFSLIEVVAGTLYLDKVFGTKFRFCAREDCKEAFELATQHTKQFCSPECAHVVAVRNSRARSKKRQKNSRRGQ